MTTREKIDNALGISGGKSIDDMLNDLNIESDELHKTMDELNVSLSAEVQKIDETSLKLQHGEQTGILAIKDLDLSLKEIEDIIAQSKRVFIHIVDNITSSDLIDSELVHASAAIIESIHLNIAEFISIYKQKTKFVEKIKLMVLQQQYRIDLANLKHKQNMELLEAKKKEPEAIDVDSEGMEFDTDKIMKSMSKSGAFDFLTAKQETVRFEDSDSIRDPEIDSENDDDEDEDEDDEDAPKKKKR